VCQPFVNHPEQFTIPTLTRQKSGLLFGIVSAPFSTSSGSA
jgi:hypothetical protein